DVCSSDLLIAQTLTPEKWDAMSKSEVETALLGLHTFGVQFIWSGYGRATVRRDGDTLRIEGEQRGKEGELKIAGELVVIDPRTLEVHGEIDTDLPDCCGKKSVSGTLRFTRTSRRGYWRLQDPQRQSLCGKYTCFYYIDLFAGGPATP